jgi:DNA-binding transcriptional regulator GbsR (MarR family)
MKVIDDTRLNHRELLILMEKSHEKNKRELSKEMKQKYNHLNDVSEMVSCLQITIENTGIHDEIHISIDT